MFRTKGTSVAAPVGPVVVPHLEGEGLGRARTLKPDPSLRTLNRGPGSQRDSR